MSAKHVARRPFSVLLVCTGNICRSPVAEQALRARFQPTERADATMGISAAVFRSAGTHARPGDGMTPQAAELSVRLGGEPGDHVATRLTRDLIEESDLVLGMARDHRREIVTMQPRASRSTFTLVEFSRLVTSVGSESEMVEQLRAAAPHEFMPMLVAMAASRRGYGAVTSEEDDDIVDPYRRSQETYDRAGRAIGTAVETIVDSLQKLTI